MKLTLAKDQDWSMIVNLIRQNLVIFLLPTVNVGWFHIADAARNYVSGTFIPFLLDSQFKTS